MEITPLGPPFGAEVRGWDPGRDVTDRLVHVLKEALAEHLVLVFRGHRPPEDEELVEFARRFGPLFAGGELFGDRRPHREILPVTNLLDDDGFPLGTGGSVEFPWHIDYSYMKGVARETFLDAVELPQAPSRTYFCSLYVALETLPGAQVSELRRMQARHGLRTFYTDPDDLEELRALQARKNERNARVGISPTPYKEYVADRPVVLRHPETGREALYVSPGNTSCITGLSAEEGRALLDRLFAHATRSSNVLCHEWQVGDLVLFDAFGCMHRRDRFARSDRRYMRQLSTLTSVPSLASSADHTGYVVGD
jgi:pentalenolactone F synthase